MELSGTRKAALLLMSLDASTAGELLKSVEPDTVAQIAAELAHLRSDKGHAPDEAAESIQEFFSLLAEPPDDDQVQDSFLQDMIESAVGKDQAEEVLGQVDHLLAARDPFQKVRPAKTKDIARALAGEPAQVAALVLAELPPKKSIELLGLLEEETQTAAVAGMAGGDPVAADTSVRVANAVQRRLEQFNKPQPVESEGEVPAAVAVETDEDDEELELRRKNQQHRKVALLLRGLEKGVRDNLLQGITERDQQSAEAVQRMMVIWEDVPLVADRAFQEVLRQIDSRNLALALMGSDPAAETKIRDNISERAGAMIDEEASLMSDPKQEDIEAAREVILDALRGMNTAGELTFEESE